MEKILGLDLGVSSIGWAVITQDSENEENNTILDCGVRIVPLNSDEISEFQKGGNVPTNVKRRQSRGMRRNLQRYRWRRHRLYQVLRRLGMMPDRDLMNRFCPQGLYALRERALREPLSLQEIGRIFIHLNNWRGYRSNRKEQVDKDGKKPSEYLKQIAENESMLNGQTIGQYFAARLREDETYRVRQQIFNRETYMREFDLIWATQAQYHPQVLTEANRHLIRDKIIYRQRPLKSAKKTVGECALEWYYALDKETHKPIVLPNGQYRIVRPKCAPNTSPLAQVCKVWESIHNLRINDALGQPRKLSLEEKKKIFYTLQNMDKNLKERDLLTKVLKLSPKLYTVDRLVKEKGLEYNRTKAVLASAFKKMGIQRDDLLQFEPEIEEVDWVNPETGEVGRRLQVRGDFDQQPLYRLWHLIYATEDEHTLIRLLQERYGFTEAQAAELAKIDFNSAGYARKSHRAMRRLLPHYEEGLDYAAACQAAGYRHAQYLTTAENEARQLLDKLEVIPKNSLRNPVVEKILNQMIHLVNDLIETYGRPDAIRVELARELKQSAQEREATSKQMRSRERENAKIREEIAELLNMPAESITRAMVEKYRLYQETDGISLYSGKKIPLAVFLRGEGVDVEHIIPKVSRFDDSFSNKTFCETALNQLKSNLTAYDFMKAQPVPGLQSFEAYTRMVKDLYDSKKISRTKYNNLMMTGEQLLEDTGFLQRQLRETQYIARKALEILRQVCRKVNSTTGSVTDFLRHQWGWDNVIHDLRLPQFKQAELTEISFKNNGTQPIEVIKGWNKRMDHRHHALDALVAACTSQSHIQRINNLNQILAGKEGSERREELLRIGRAKFIAGKRPFSYAQVAEAISNILVSHKQSHRVATRSRNRPKGSDKVQITLTPRGSLHEETVYGRIKQYKKVLLNTSFSLDNLAQMAHPHQRELVEARLAQYDNDPKKAFENLDQNPILYGPDGIKRLTHVTLWEYTLVARKSIAPDLSEKSVEKIADNKVRQLVQARLESGGGKSKEAFKNVGNEPIILGKYPVKRVRVKNPAEKVIALPRGFVEPGSNHHIAIYRDASGELCEHVVTFWEAFQRVRLGLPAIITDIAAALDHISQLPGELPPLQLPENPEWQLVVSLARNDMFVFGLDPSEIDLTNPKNRKTVSKHLFKVRKITKGGYWFLHHLETTPLEDVISKKVGRCKQCSSSSLTGAVKVKVNRLGHIVGIGPSI